MRMDGILLVDKPAGWTSFDVVAKIRGIIRSESGQKRPKVGHTGTLDPLATGLLVLTVGNYCKRAQEFSKLDKTYQVVMRLGQSSTTGDAEGEITNVAANVPSYQDVFDILQNFIGDIMQKPPAFSAVKINGQRAYKLARQGKAVDIEPRKIKIHSIQLTDYNYPEVKFTATVGSGTYIRSLVEDIGHKLGTGAYMSSLRRTTVGQFDVSDSLSPESDVSLIAEHLMKF